MTQATTIRFGRQAILIGDGATPVEAFAAPCGLTSLTKTTNVETNTVNIPDCTDPDLSSWLGIDEISRQIQLSFGGILNVESLQLWQEWDLAGGYKNVRWFRDLDLADGGGYLQGPALLTAFEETGEEKQRYQISGTITFDGKPTWTDAAP